MVTKYSQKSETLPDLKPLSMLLKGTPFCVFEGGSALCVRVTRYNSLLTPSPSGTITAVVNGGIKNYAEAFFTDDYTMSQPMKVDALKRALQQHSALLGKLMKYAPCCLVIQSLQAQMLTCAVGSTVRVSQRIPAYVACMRTSSVRFRLLSTSSDSRTHALAENYSQLSASVGEMLRD